MSDKTFIVTEELLHDYIECMRELQVLSQEHRDERRVQYYENIINDTVKLMENQQ